MNKLSLAAVLCVGFALLASAADKRPSDSLERSFAEGGRIRLDLSAGGYTISGSKDAKLRVEWSVRDAEKLKQVHVTPRITGSSATVEIEGPKNNDFDVHILVPARTDLVVRLTAGDLKIEGIQGNKDVESHAGDVEIEIGPVADLKYVEASIWAGDLKASALNISKEGLFRSIKWNGKGRYEVQAHLKAGDLRLY
jgi:hypothetical protein